MNAPEDALAILTEHEYVDTYEAVACSCGAYLMGSALLTATRSAWHRAHVAQVLAEWVAGEKARAWDRGKRAAVDSHPSWWNTLPNPYRVSGNCG